MSKLRLSTRQMMAMVVVMAVALWAGRLRQLSDGYRRLSWFHESLATETMMEVSGYGYERDHPREVIRARAIAAHHRRLARRYDRLVLFPWQSPPHDPLAPQGWNSVDPDAQVSAVAAPLLAPDPSPSPSPEQTARAQTP